MKLSFDNWVISKDTGLLGYQYDNESQELWVTGDLPQGWAWDALIQDGSHYDVWPLTLAERGAYITLNDENLAVPGSFYIQIRGTKGEQVQHTNIVSVYISRSLVGPGTWPTLPTEFSQAEKAIKELNAHPPIPGENGFWLLWNLETSSYEESQLPVPVGPAGPANVLEMGEVTTLAPEEAATAELTGESPHQVLHLGLPQGKTGEPGPTGPTPQLTVGEVTTLDPEEYATAELSGTPEKPVLSLGIPQGKTGQPGPIGNPGPANTLQVGQVTTLAPDQPATAEITGASPTQTLNLGLPQGKTGPTGATPELFMGEVTTLDPGEPARAELSGSPEAPVLSLGLPQGQPGKDGVQLEDDAITSTAAWSSRKIVDALCPAFTAEGNPVTCQPVEGYPLDVKVNFEPIQAGEGDPSPENVRPISGWDGLQVARYGKNLLNLYDATSRIGLVTLDSNSFRANINNNYFASVYLSKNLVPLFKPGVSISLSCHIENANPEDYMTVVIPGEYTSGVPSYEKSGSKGSTSVSFVVPDTLQKASIVELRFLRQSVRYTDSTTVVSDIQLEFSPIPTGYKPYQDDTYDIALPETVYGGTVDAVTGVGSKTWGFIASYNGEAIPGEWISDRDVYAPGTTPTTGAQVAYKLATPEPFQAPGNQPIPALPGANTLYTDGDRVAVTGKQDLTYTLRQIQEQLAAVSGVTEALTGTD